MKRWEGATVFCLASGPSLTDEQIARVVAWRDSGPDRRIVVTNTTFQKVPTADALFAMDRPWWKVYREEVLRTFKGEPWSCLGGLKGVHQAKGALIGVKGVRGWVGNSGGGAILLAVSFGAARIFLLGYDNHAKGGRHHHPDHPKGLGNAGSMKSWPSRMAKIAARVSVPVVNCSPGTALTCWPRGDLNDAI